MLNVQSSLELVVSVLHVTCVWISGERTDRVLSSSHGRGDQIARSTTANRETLRGCARYRFDVRDHFIVGDSSLYSNARRIPARRHWTPRDRTLIRNHGGTRWIDTSRLSPASSLLLHNDLHQFLSVVDQITGVSEAIAAAARQGLQLSFVRQRDCLCHLDTRSHEASALHAAGVSVTGVASRAAVGRDQFSAAPVQGGCSVTR